MVLTLSVRDFVFLSSTKTNKSYSSVTCQENGEGGVSGVTSSVPRGKLVGVVLITDTSRDPISTRLVPPEVETG